MVAKITTIDRLIFTLLFSFIIHTVIVLGISFNVPSPPANTQAINLEITLVKQQTELAPDQADFLAQVNNQGGGATEQAKPDPTSNPPQPAKLVIDPPKPAAVIRQKLPQQQIITQQYAKRKLAQTPKPDATVKPIAKAVTPKPKLSAQEMMFYAKNNIADLQQALADSVDKLSKLPRRYIISPSTKAFAAAAYLKQWELKIERLGKMNYPPAARRQDINGSLMLSVDIETDGSVRLTPDAIKILRSSGYDVLDRAAMRIARLGAPYAPLADDILPAGYNTLTVHYKWCFGPNRFCSPNR